MKKDIFFTFGPNDGYFFSSPPSRRRVGFDGMNMSPERIKHQWVATNVYGDLWSCFVSPNHSVGLGWTGLKFYTNLTTWLSTRMFSPTRVIFGPGLSALAWIPFGDHYCNKYAPKTVFELVNSAQKLYTNIRIAALGVDDSYIIIWEDGTMKWDLKNRYEALDNALANCTAEDVTFVAISPFRAGDYFVYFDSKKLAMFQVSEAFGRDIEDVLRSEGIRSQAIVRREERVAPAINIPETARRTNFLDGVARSVGIGANLLAIGASVAGLVGCTVM